MSFAKSQAAEDENAIGAATNLYKQFNRWLPADLLALYTYIFLIRVKILINRLFT